MREGAWSGETELVALDGHAIAVSQVILAHKAPNGTVAFLSTIARDITERQRGEAARRENDQRLQVALSGIKMAVFHQDRALRYTWMHQPQLAYSPDRVVGRTDAELLPPEAARQVTEIKQRVLETGARVREEVSVVADGATLVFDLVAEPLLDASGEIIGLTGATLDITERKQAEDALAHREAELRESQRIAGIGSWEWTIATGVVAWSEGMNHVLGRGLDLPAPTFETLASFYTPESWERLGAAIARTIETGAPYELELEMIRADGATCWTTTRGEAIRGADGTVVKLRGTVHDITKRRQAEADLRMQSAALHAAADAIVITDRAGVIEWVNPAFTRLTGYPAQDALGKNPKDLVKSGKHAPAFYREFWETLLAGRTWHGEMINRRKDGSLYTEEQTVTPIFGASGAILHFVAIKEDITERLQLEAQFRQAQKMESVGQLASGIAHDFNNLLTVINGMSELVLEQEASHDGPLYADVQEIRRAGERAATLTRQLLAFSRQQILEPRVLNVHTVVAGMESLLRRLLGEDIDLVVVPTPDASCVKADPGQLEQVITNLAVNARDAMPQGGRLTIETQTVAIDEDAARQQGVAVPLGPYVLLAVSDSGVGMDEATRVHIFEPFFTTKGPGKGTGLGLSTVYGIVKQSQGFIRVESEVGQGTSVKILLPQVTEAAGPERPGPTVVSSSGTETILLVEDNAGLRKLATRLLEPAGYIVFGAATGEEALRLLEGHEKPVHLLLSDVVLPGMNGRRLAEQLAQTHPGIKVLYMSGYTSDTIVRHGVLEARMPFLTKPFTAAALLRKVREVLDS
jgi:PAS domain S-box-containing protein